MTERKRGTRRTVSSPDAQFDPPTGAPQPDLLADDGGARRKGSRARQPPLAGGRDQPGNRTTVPPDLLTVGQAAEILNTGEKTVWRLTKSKQLRAIKIGHLVRIDPRDLEDFIRDRRTR